MAGMAAPPPLPYAVEALEPILDAKTVRMHHDVIEAKYYTKLTELLTPGAKLDPSAICYNTAGAALHRLYWQNLVTPGQGSRPSAALNDTIVRDFGSAKSFVTACSDVSLSIRGEGWALLGWSPDLQRLVLMGVHGHTDGLVPGADVLLAIDVWEHAYITRYGPDREAYVRALWSAVNWATVSYRFGRATAMM